MGEVPAGRPPSWPAVKNWVPVTDHVEGRSRSVATVRILAADARGARGRLRPEQSGPAATFGRATDNPRDRTEPFPLATNQRRRRLKKWPIRKGTDRTTIAEGGGRQSWFPTSCM